MTKIEELRAQNEAELKALQAKSELLKKNPDEFKATLLAQLELAAGTLSILAQLGEADTWQSEEKFENVCYVLGIKKPAKRERKDPFAAGGNGHKFLVALKDGKSHSLKQVYQSLLIPFPQDVTNKLTLIGKAVDQKFVELTGDNLKITSAGKDAIKS